MLGSVSLVKKGPGRLWFPMGTWTFVVLSVLFFIAFVLFGILSLIHDPSERWHGIMGSAVDGFMSAFDPAKRAVIAVALFGSSCMMLILAVFLFVAVERKRR